MKRSIPMVALIAIVCVFGSGCNRKIVRPILLKQGASLSGTFTPKADGVYDLCLTFPMSGRSAAADSLVQMENLRPGSSGIELAWTVSANGKVVRQGALPKGQISFLFGERNILLLDSIQVEKAMTYEVTVTVGATVAGFESADSRIEVAPRKKLVRGP